MRSFRRATHESAAEARTEFWPRSRFYRGQYGRMFRHLPPLEKPSETAEFEALIKDVLSEGPDSDSSAEQASGIPAGYTYFGQFLAHDITFNPVSDLSKRRDPEGLTSYRTPRLDLDSLYGRGPTDSPYLYEPPGGERPVGRLAVGWGMGAEEEDLPRTEGRPAIALIGDPRNDEHTIISQLHLAFIKLHNRFFDYYAKCGFDDTFERAQRLTCWHYQWVVLNDYLPRICEKEVLEEIWPKEARNAARLPAPRWYAPRDESFIPLEFSGAAFRFGHSMVRPAYHINSARANKIPTFGRGDLGNLLGFNRLRPEWTIQWDLFFEFEGCDRTKVQQSGLIDLRLSPSLYQLPPEVIGEGPQEGGQRPELNLARRNIERGYQLGLPSGQDVARAMGEVPLDPVHKSSEDPLWVYVLREAKIQQGGKKLGRIGSNIVAESIMGLIAGDRLSYLSMDPRWRPVELAGGSRIRDLASLIRAAGMPVSEADLIVKAAFGRGPSYDPRLQLAESLRKISADLAAARRTKAAATSAGPGPCLP
jgi:hypothetical protein